MFEVSFKNVPMEGEKNAFDYDKKVCFTSPSGKEYLQGCFLKNDGVYASRVYADEEGTWDYKLLDDSMQFTDSHGEFICERTSNDLHGKVRLCGERNKKFRYEDGTPYNMLGFECDWLFHIDDGAKDIVKADTLMKDIADNRFNMIIVNLWANHHDWNYAGGKGSTYDFSDPVQIPFMRNKDASIDYEHLDLEYFDRVDKIFDRAKELGLVIHLMVYVWNKNVPWPQLLSEEDNRFFTYVVSRYAAYPNLIWDVSKEALNHATVEQIASKCETIRREDPFNTLLTVHDGGFCTKRPDLVDINTLQCWDYGIYQITKKRFENDDTHALLNIEHGGYERGVYDVFYGSYDEPVKCIERNYEILFAGSYTNYYWQDTSWNIVIWDKNDLAPWVRPKYEYYKYLAGYMEHMNYQNAYPSEPGSPCSMCMDDGKYYYYLKLSGTKCVRVMKKKKTLPECVEAEWFNPLTNEYRTEMSTCPDSYKFFISPFGDDLAVLRLKY